MLGMQALHIKVSKPAVPQYGVALGSEGNTGTALARAIRRGAWG
jgi:hypothetical protein